MEPICYGQTNQGTWCQETYDALRKNDAGKRARQLRNAGYKTIVSSMGNQVTPVGVCKLTSVTIFPGKNQDTCNLPYVQTNLLSTLAKSTTAKLSENPLAGFSDEEKLEWTEWLHS